MRLALYEIGVLLMIELNMAGLIPRSSQHALGEDMVDVEGNLLEVQLLSLDPSRRTKTLTPFYAALSREWRVNRRVELASATSCKVLGSFLAPSIRATASCDIPSIRLNSARWRRSADTGQ